MDLFQSVQSLCRDDHGILGDLMQLQDHLEQLKLENEKPSVDISNSCSANPTTQLALYPCSEDFACLITKRGGGDDRVNHIRHEDNRGHFNTTTKVILSSPQSSSMTRTMRSDSFSCGGNSGNGMKGGGGLIDYDCIKNDHVDHDLTKTLSPSQSILPSNLNVYQERLLRSASTIWPRNPIGQIDSHSPSIKKILPPTSLKAIGVKDFELLGISGQDLILTLDYPSCIHGATMEVLIQLLPFSDQQDTRVFLMGYRVCHTPSEFLDCIIRVWHDCDSKKMPNSRTLLAFRLRTINMIKMWMTNHAYDFDRVMYDSLYYFIHSIPPDCNLDLIKRLVLEKIGHHRGLGRGGVGGSLHSWTSTGHNESSSPLPNPYTISNHSTTNNTNQFLSLNPHTVAEQITLLDYQIFKAIRPEECMKHTWTSTFNTNNAPNIFQLTQRFNNTSQMVTSSIVQETLLKKRKTILIFFLKVAQALKELGNYHSLLSMVASLESAPISRLKKTWALVENTSYFKHFQEIKSLVGSENSYKKLRQVLKSQSLPLLPYIGVYLSDLTFIEDGNPNTIPNPSNPSKLLNFSKMKMIANVIEDLRLYQTDHYQCALVENIRDLLLYYDSLPRMYDNQLFQLSLDIEPRGC